MVKYVSWGEYHWRHQRHLYYQRNKKLIEELNLKQLEKVCSYAESSLEISFMKASGQIENVINK